MNSKQPTPPPGDSAAEPVSPPPSAAIDPRFKRLLEIVGEALAESYLAREKAKELTSELLYVCEERVSLQKARDLAQAAGRDFFVMLNCRRHDLNRIVFWTGCRGTPYRTGLLWDGARLTEDPTEP